MVPCELLIDAVCWFSFFQGYFSELDNSELSHLIPLALQNKRDVLFGNLPEIYDFHNRLSLLLVQLGFILIC